jgi:RNA polymerase subunit RPABC4/transcription elongation factor Spt4
MGEKVSNAKKCRRCHQPISSDIICQACKNELLNHYEVSSDWQTAFEIEKAQLVASRYRYNAEEDDEGIF